MQNLSEKVIAEFQDEEGNTIDARKKIQLYENKKAPINILLEDLEEQPFERGQGLRDTSFLQKDPNIMESNHSFSHLLKNDINSVQVEINIPGKRGSSSLKKEEGSQCFPGVSPIKGTEQNNTPVMSPAKSSTVVALPSIHQHKRGRQKFKLKEDLDLD
jgi:hypothetical protein